MRNDQLARQTSALTRLRRVPRPRVLASKANRRRRLLPTKARTWERLEPGTGELSAGPVASRAQPGRGPGSLPALGLAHDPNRAYDFGGCATTRTAVSAGGVP